MRQHGEVMIVAKGIRQGVSLVRQCHELAQLDRLQHLELVPQIFHLLAPFMETLLGICLGAKRLPKQTEVGAPFLELLTRAVDRPVRERLVSLQGL
jgi:hypothetical protein